jgi:hypothetical protein
MAYRFLQEVTIMTIPIDLNNDQKCPSCGFPKEDSTRKDMSHAVVCFYCYLRGSVSNLKLSILFALNELDKPVTIYELAEIMTNHPIFKGRSAFTPNRIKGSLELMTRSKNKLILKGKRKNRSKNGAGRKQNTYKIGKRKGIQYLERYLDQWDRGKIVHLNQIKSKGIRRILRRKENSGKSLSIKHKIASGEYDRFEFLFIKYLKKSIDKEDS